MDNIQNIINIEKHPINNIEYVISCNKQIRENSILIMKNFLNDDCLQELKSEALRLENQAFYCSQNHTILLNKPDKTLSPNDPTNVEVVSDKGCVPHDLLNKNSKLNLLYNSSSFKNFLKGVLDLVNLYPYKDTLSSINYNYLIILT